MARLGCRKSLLQPTVRMGVQRSDVDEVGLIPPASRPPAILAKRIEVLRLHFLARSYRSWSAGFTSAPMSSIERRTLACGSAALSI